VNKHNIKNTLFARELTLKTLTLEETRGTWSFHDKCLYFKINNYEITASDKFYEFTELFHNCKENIWLKLSKTEHVFLFVFIRTNWFW
jgi:hypothetical protein